MATQFILTRYIVTFMLHALINSVVLVTVNVYYRSLLLFRLHKFQTRKVHTETYSYTSMCSIVMPTSYKFSVG